MKAYTEEDLRNAYRTGFEFSRQYFESGTSDELDEDDFIESLNAPKKEEKEIPITYGLIKATCGWSEFAEKTNKNVYTINEFGDYQANEVFYITESQAKQLKFI